MSGQDTLSQAEIDALLAAVAQEPSGGDERTDRLSQKVQNVDFRRQSKFNRDQLRTLEMLHETFSRLGGTYLSGALRSVAEISVLSAEQVTYGEFISSLPVPALTGILDLSPLETNAILAFDLPLVFTMIDRILGGPGHGSPRLRELTDIELQLSRTFIERLLRELSTSWSELVGVDFSLRHTEMNPQFAQIAPPTELSVLLSFQIRVHESTGLMALCLPWRSIEPVASNLTASGYFSGARDARATDELRRGLEDIAIELRAEVGAVELTIDDVLALEPGDVIRLGVPAEHGVRLLAGPTATYRVFPGSHRRHLAVQVHDRIARPEHAMELLAEGADAPLELDTVNEHQAVERAATIAADACATVLGTLFGQPGSFDAVGVDEEHAELLGSLEYPCVAVEVAFTEGITGKNLFVLRPDQVRQLAAAMMGLPEPIETGDLTEIELSAASEAMNQMMGSVSTEMAQAIGVPTDIAPPNVQLLNGAADASAFGEARYAARFTLHVGPLDATVVQLVPQDFAETLVAVFGSGDAMHEVLADRKTVAAASQDETYSAVERTARIAAESAAQVLSTLIGGEASATLPNVVQDPDDPLGRLTYPLVTVEVSYVSGVNGANLFVLTPAQARQLATIMMGLEEPMSTGDLSEIELSAVCEAMNQMMGAATNILADTLTMAIEVAPPTCVVMASADEARAAFGEPAFSTQFRLVSDRLTADVVQLVPADFAEHLRRAFAAADLGRAAVGAAAEPGGRGAAGPREPGGLTLRPNGILPSSLRSVKVRVSAELGRARLPIGQVVNLPPGAIVALDRSPHDPIDVLVNGRAFAEARLVLVDGEYAVQIVNIVPQQIAAA